MIIGFRGFTTPVHGVFDTQGDLWVSDSGSNAVFEYTTAQLAVGRPNVIPNITITSNPAFTEPIGIAFDAAGDLLLDVDKVGQVTEAGGPPALS